MAKTTSFGFKQVAENAKSSLVNQVFSSVANKYDVMNDVMSFGIHRLWKDHLVKKIPLIDQANIIDMAGGTGDIAMRIIKKYREANHNFNITIADLNQEMLETGKERFIDNNLFAENIKFAIENGEKTSFAANNFDIYTICYGIRNFANLEKGVKEAYRILKPGGIFLCLEFNQVENQFLQQIYDLYSMNVIPNIGGLITGDKDSYQYFVESIRIFPNSNDFINIMEQAGFEDSVFEKLTGGITTMYIGYKK